MNHTPTPWTLMAIDDDREWIQGANEEIVCDIHDDHLEENFSCVNPIDAEYIVQCVNSHDELLEAANSFKIIVGKILSHADVEREVSKSLINVFNYLEKAIAKASLTAGEEKE